jgi:hypothetical protein
MLGLMGRKERENKPLSPCSKQNLITATAAVTPFTRLAITVTATATVTATTLLFAHHNHRLHGSFSSQWFRCHHPHSDAFTYFRPRHPPDHYITCQKSVDHSLPCTTLSLNPWPRLAHSHRTQDISVVARRRDADLTTRSAPPCPFESPSSALAPSALRRP